MLFLILRYTLWVFFFFFLVNFSEVDYLRDIILERELKIEVLEERVDFLRSALNSLDKKYRKLLDRHSKCRVKTVFLHR